MEFQPIDRLTDAQVEDLHRMFQNEWWTKGRTLEEVRAMLQGSDIVVGLGEPVSRRLAGFARVQTDGVFKALIFDVIIDPAFRGRGLGRRLMARILGHPRLARVRHFELYCLPEMAPFYERWGFTEEVAGVVLMRRIGVP